MDRRPLKVQAGAAAPAVHDAPLPGGVPAIRERPARQRPAPPAEDPFPLGWRYRLTTSADGRKDVQQVPLTPEDLMNPQEGDVLSDGFSHNRSVLPVGDAMERHLEKRPGLLVTRGVVLMLDDGTNCAPDVAVLESKVEGQEIDTSNVERAVNLRAVKARLVFALEAVSTSDAKVEEKDTVKNVQRYAAHGVPEYLTYYPMVEQKVKNLVGRRLPKKGGNDYAGKYRQIPLNARRRVYSQKLDLEFVIDPSSQRLVAYDATTGRQLLTSKQEEAGRVEAQRHLAEETEARQKAEQEKQKAEQEKQAEADARQKAEQLNREMMAELERLRARLAGGGDDGEGGPKPD